MIIGVEYIILIDFGLELDFSLQLKLLRLIYYPILKYTNTFLVQNCSFLY